MKKVRNKLLSTVLSMALVITSVPIVSVSAAVDMDDTSLVVPPKLSKTDDPDYNPVFSFEPYQDAYDTIVNASADINEIGKLPDYEGFKNLTGYVREDRISLSLYRTRHGAGTAFDNAAQEADIYIVGEAELDLLSKLVNGTAENETAIEQAFYSSASYKLGGELIYTGDKYIPIGTAEHPFNGTFDGDEWEISGIKMIDNVGASNSIYTNTQFAGLFGYIGTNGIVRKLGITNMTINLPYTLGGDVGFIAGCNYGLIDTCYVYSRSNCRITMSNTTGGGITAENYGEMKSCWADAYIDIDTDSGSYSEPQPIATVNHDGAVITDCYYIRHGISSFSRMITDSYNDAVNNFHVNMSSDTGGDNFVGWKYSGDASLINGTAVGYGKFISAINTLPGMSAYGNGTVGANSDDFYNIYNNYRNYTTSIDFADLAAMVGTGNDFDITYMDVDGMFTRTSASDYNHIVYAVIKSHDDWVNFCNLVNGTVTGETSDEQQFWSKVGVMFNGTTQTIGGKNIYSFDVYQDDPSLGTEEHPYNGYVSGENITFHLILENHSGGTASPIFGYIGPLGYVKNVNLVITGSDLSGYMGTPIFAQSVSGGFYNSTIFDNSYRCISDTSGVNIYPSHTDFDVIANKEYDDIYLFGLGSLSHLSYIYCGFAYQWYNDEEATTPAGYNYIKIFHPDDNNSQGNATGSRCKYMYGETYCKYCMLTDYIADYKLDNNNFQYDSAIRGSRWNPATEHFYYIKSYPALGTPEKNTDGKYLVRTSQNFVWLMNHGNGDDAILMNTIDMSDVNITGTHSGYFNLDGTLTDSSDICNNIDLGVTKCYGILNLQMTNSILSFRLRYKNLNSTYYNYNWTERQADDMNASQSNTNRNDTTFSNVYFIGGNYTVNSDDRKFSSRPWLGKRADNVHVSITQNILNFNNNNGEKCMVTPFEYAYNSSVSSDLHANCSNSSYNTGGAAALAFNCDSCVCYTKLIFDRTNQYHMHGLAYNATHCLSRMSTYFSGAFTLNNNMTNGLCYNATACLADKTYDFQSDNTVPVHIFGTNSNTNITVSGTIKSDIGTRTDCFAEGNVSFGSYTYGLVFTPSSKMQGCINWRNLCDSTFFKGVYDYYLRNGSDSIFSTPSDKASTCICEGSVNLHKWNNPAKYSNQTTVPNISKKFNTTGNGSKSFSWMDGYGGVKICNTAFDFSDLDDVLFDGNSIKIISNYGSRVGTFINYSDMNVTADTSFSSFIIVNSSNPPAGSSIINYGNINFGENTYVENDFYCIYESGGNGTVVIKNFGDLNFCTGKYFCQVGGIYSVDYRAAVNYGNITMHKTVDYGYVRSVMGIRNDTDNYRWAMRDGTQAINHGDIEIILDASYNTNRVSIIGVEGGTNFGDITVKSNDPTFDTKCMLYVLGACYRNYGNIDVHDCYLQSAYIRGTSYQTDTGYAVSRGYQKQWNGIQAGNVNVTNVKTHNDFDYAAGGLYVYSDNTDNEWVHSFINEGNLTINGLECDKAYIVNGIICGGWYSRSFPNASGSGTYSCNILHGTMDVDIRNNVDIENVNFNGMRYTGMYGNFIGTDTMGVSRAHVTIKDCTGESFAYNGVANGAHTASMNSLTVIDNDVNIENMTLSRQCYVSGYTTAAGGWGNNNILNLADTGYGSLSNIYSFGHINVNANGAPVIVSGIGNSLYCNAGIPALNKSGVFNGCDITVTSDNSDIYLSGVHMSFNNSVADNAKVYNAINAGKLTANTAGKAYIYGITNSAAQVCGVANYGDIETNNASCDIFAIAGYVNSEANGFVNYGHIINPNRNDVSNSGLIGTTNRSGNSSPVRYGINYGAVDSAQSVNSGEPYYIIDLSGNKNAVPSSGITFSTDASMSGTVNKTSRGLNVFSTVVGAGEAETDELISRHVTYADIIKPDFAFRLNQPIITQYTDATTRTEYNNGHNLFNYEVEDKLCGKLRDKVNEFSGEGGYVECIVDSKGKNLMGYPVECTIFDYMTNSTKPAWMSKVNMGDITFADYFDNVLRQVDDAQGVSIYDINIQSVDKYTTKESDTAYITNASTLTPFQGSIINDSDVYSQNIVTISDVYVLTNTFEDIDNENIAFKFTVNRSYDSTVHLYAEPVLYDSSETYKQALRECVDNPVVTAENNTTTVNIGEVGDTKLYILGYVESANGTHKNIIVLRLHNKSTAPAGWVTSFEFPRDVDDNPNLRTDAFNESVDFYDNGMGYAVGENDAFIVNQVDMTTYTYPEYIMSEEFLRTTDGDYKFGNFRAYRDSSNLWTGWVNISFGLQNVVSYRATISSDDNKDPTAVMSLRDAPTEGSSSVDGTVILKHNTVTTDYPGDFTINGRYVDDNFAYFADYIPYLHGGNKTVTFYGTNASGDEFILFTIKFVKQESFENYFVDYPNRYYRQQHNSADTSMTVSSVLNLEDFYHNDFLKMSRSTLSNVANCQTTILDMKDHTNGAGAEQIESGSYTKYPEGILMQADCVAENGESMTYYKTKNYKNFDVLDFTGARYENNVSGTYHRYAMNEDTDTFSLALYANSNKVYHLCDYFTPDGEDTNIFVGFVMKRMDIYLDGVYHHSTTTYSQSSPNTLYDSVYGLSAKVSDWYGKPDEIYISKDDTVPKADLPDGVITIRCYAECEINDVTLGVLFDDVCFSKQLSDERQLISVYNNKRITTPFISDVENDISTNVDMETNDIIYNIDYTEMQHLYVTDIVEPDVTSLTAGYLISSGATLQKWNGSAWVNIGTGGTEPIYENMSFTTAQLGAGIVNEYRILAQDYSEADTANPDRAEHYTLFTYSIMASTRNKTISIEFDDADDTTMDLYDEIINEYGNLAIEVRNMNGPTVNYHQTKVYVGEESLESNYYNISVGNYAIVAHLPEGYEYSVKIIGGSSEGNLSTWSQFDGKKLRLPYANEQAINMKVRLTKTDPLRQWGVKKRISFFDDVRYNTI